VALLRAAHAVVGEDQYLPVRWEGVHGPGHEVDQRIAMRHIHLAQIGHKLGPYPLKVVVLRDVEALRAGPVAVAVEGAREAVHLGHDGHAVAGAEAVLKSGRGQARWGRSTRR